MPVCVPGYLCTVVAKRSAEQGMSRLGREPPLRVSLSLRNHGPWYYGERRVSIIIIHFDSNGCVCAICNFCRRKAMFPGLPNKVISGHSMDAINPRRLFHEVQIE